MTASSHCKACQWAMNSFGSTIEPSLTLNDLFNRLAAKVFIGAPAGSHSSPMALQCGVSMSCRPGFLTSDHAACGLAAFLPLSRLGLYRPVHTGSGHTPTRR